MKTVRVGTEDLKGAVVLSVDWNEISLEKDGRKFRLELEYEHDYHSMCEGDCYSGYSSAYFIADEIVE